MTAAEESQEGITLDDVFRALGHPIRRHALLALNDRGAIGRAELESILAERGGRDLEVVRTRLYHHHLPHLDGVDLIDWNRGEGTVERGSNFEEVRLHLDNVQELR